MPDFKDLRFFFKTIKFVVLLLRMPGSPSVSDQPRRPCFCLPLPTIHAPHATDVPRSRASPIKACPFSLAHAHPNVYSSCLVSHLERSAQNMDVSYLNRVKYVLESRFIYVFIFRENLFKMHFTCYNVWKSSELFLCRARNMSAISTV